MIPDSQRRDLLWASIVVALAVFLLVLWANLAHANQGVPLRGVFLVMSQGAWNGLGIVALAMVGLLEAVVIFQPRFLGRSAGPSPRTTGSHLHVRCRQCGTVDWVRDAGRRPLVHFCPLCGTEGTYGEETEDDPDFVYTEVEVKLGCKQCRTTFSIPEPLARPLYTRCPNCGAPGVLREGARTVEAVETPLQCRGCGFNFDLYSIDRRGAKEIQCPRCRKRTPLAPRASATQGA